MPVMFLLNPPARRGRNGRRLLSLRYPPRMGAPAKPRVRPSRTIGGRRVSSALREILGLKTGERPVRHRITFYRKPGKKRKVLVRTPFAAFRNPKRRRKGVKSNMAKRRRRKKARHNARRRHIRRHRRVIVLKANPRRRRYHRRRAKRNAFAFNPRRHRRGRRRVRAIVLANPRRIRRHRRYHRNPVALANPFRPKSLIGPLTSAAGMFGGYFVTNYLTEQVYPMTLGRFIPVDYEKWARPGAKIAMAVGLSYVARKFIFKRKPTVGNYILLGGLFSAVKDLIGNIAEIAGAGNYPTVYNALKGYTEEPLASYVPEPVGALSGLSEDKLERYEPLY